MEGARKVSLVWEDDHQVQALYRYTSLDRSPPSLIYTCPCLQAGLPPRLCGRGRQGRQQDQQALSPALLRGPRAWSQVPDTWLLVLCRWSSVLAPWSLVLVLGPRALVVSPWSLGLEHWALGIGPWALGLAESLLQSCLRPWQTAGWEVWREMA